MASESQRHDAAEALRAAVDRTVRATLGQAQSAGDRAHDIVGEATTAADRVRGRLEDLRPARADELRALRARVHALEEQVARLEQAAALQARAPSRRPGNAPRGGGEAG